MLKVLSLALILIYSALAHAQSNHSQAQSNVQGKRINGYKVLCYHYRSDLSPSQINPTYCIHLVSSYATLDPKEYVIRNSSAPVMTSSLKETDAGLKTIIAIGGVTESSDSKYSEMVQNGTLRSKFIDSVIAFMEHYNFDGLSFNWFKSYTQYRDDYVMLLKELRERFGARYELMIGYRCGDDARGSYDLVATQDIVDTIFAWAGSFAGKWTEPKQVGHHAALKQRPEAGKVAPLQSEWGTDLDLRIPSERRSVSVESCFRYLLDDLELRPEKLNLLIPFYAQSFQLTDSARASPFDTFEKGVDEWISYTTICSSLTDTNSPDVPIVTYDHNYWAAPYATKGHLWIGYDDERSARIKVDWMKGKKLGGVAVYNLEYDDFSGKCFNGKKYPLMNAIYEQLMSD